MNITPSLAPTLVVPSFLPHMIASVERLMIYPQRKPGSRQNKPLQNIQKIARPPPFPMPTPAHELDTSKSIIYGSVNVIPPTAGYTQQERMHRIDAYTGRVVAHIQHIENGSDAERNISFQQTRPFLEPAGYFSGGLLAAGYDPHEKSR